MSTKTIEQVLKENTGRWMSQPGVVGTGLGQIDDKPCIKVFVARISLGLQSAIPPVVDGHRVVMEETGEFRAQDSE